jgi:hypothetical protein
MGNQDLFPPERAELQDLFPSGGGEPRDLFPEEWVTKICFLQRGPEIQVLFPPERAEI